jgi:hypothetical protein
LVVLVVDRGPASVLARRILAMVAQLRFERAAMIASPSADIALARMYLELCDIEQGYALSFLSQAVLDSKSELCGLRDIPGVLFVPIARGQQQYVILRFEIPDEPRAGLDQLALSGAWSVCIWELLHLPMPVPRT